MSNVASHNARYRFLKIYNEGYTAGKANLPIETNPYDCDDKRDEHWLCGHTRWQLWQEAYKKGLQQRLLAKQNHVDHSDKH